MRAVRAAFLVFWAIVCLPQIWLVLVVLHSAFAATIATLICIAVGRWLNRVYARMERAQ